MQYVCYNAVSQLYCRSRTLVDRRYAFVFFRSDLYGFNIQNLPAWYVSETVQELSAHGDLESELSVN